MEGGSAEDEVLELKKQNAELLSHLQIRTDAEDKEVRQLFPDLPTTEHVIDYFACALSAKILLQGWMYITQNFICFSCNLLVYKTKHCFDIKDVVRLSKSRHAGVNPGFSLHFEDGRSVSFFSFFDRDKAMSLISKLSKAARSEDEDEDEEDQEEYVYEDAVALIGADGEAAFPEAQIPNDEAALGNTISSCEFPMTPREAFVLLYADQSKFVTKSKEYEGSSEITISQYATPTGRDGWIRELNFRYPLDGIPMCPPSTMVHEVQHCRLCSETDTLVVAYSVQSLDVPYGTYFTVETRHEFAPHPDGCKLSISMEVRFSKSTFLEGKIRSNTLSRESDRWKEWCVFARDFVEKKKGLKRTKLPAKRTAALKKKDGSEQQMQVMVAGGIGLVMLVLVMIVEWQLRALQSALPGR
eukprot:TRINITY_DN13588_c0_g1_i2.p1 TRINITY_DN13588_c0_g1~~TRINITY_DN13588_c0_g1_i2.p1  ORF type:complete len:413 (-),score=98.47 TRINITY_DN13588_c0_g1_i2:162-1400(-)